MKSRAARRRRNARVAALALVLAVAGLVRGCGISFGLPHTFARPDESRVVSMALDMAAGDLDPPHFRYPSLYLYMLSIVYAGDQALHSIKGQPVVRPAFPARSVDNPAHFLLVAVEDPARYFLLARALTALLGALTVIPVYRIAARMGGHGAGLAAAALLALTHLHVRDSHFATTDVPLTFFLVWAMAFAVEIPLTRALRSYVLAGVLAGLAASTKYAGVLVALPVLVAHLHVVRRERLGTSRLLLDRRPLAFAACLLLAFLAGTPYSLVHPVRLAADLSLQAGQMATTHGVSLGRGFWRHLGFSLLHGLGWPQLLSAAVGAGVMLKRRMRLATVLLALPVAYYVVIGRGYAVFLRYAVPLLPFLSVAAGFLVARAARFLRPRLHVPSHALALLVAAAVIAPSAWRVVETDRLLRRTDTRLLARQWLAASVPAGAAVFQTGSPFGQVELMPSREAFRSMYPGHEAGRRTLRVLERHGMRGHDNWGFDTARGCFHVNGARTSALPELVVLQLSPLDKYSEVPPAVRELLAARYRPRASFAGLDPAAPRARFDLQDAFYVPFVKPAAAPRPGPTLHIYQVVDTKGAPDSRRADCD